MYKDKIRRELYLRYAYMKNRCYYAKDKEYKNYGARGIKVVDSWLGENGFENFYKWAMENGYKKELSLDRIDVNLDYSPQNCRWVDAKEQAINRRTTHLITYNGETHSLTDWANILGIKRSTLSKRINEYGWSIARAFEENRFYRRQVEE